MIDENSGRMSRTATPELTSRIFRNSFRTWPSGVALFLLVILPFIPAMFGGYTWDDNFWLTDNLHVQSWHGLSQIWNPHHQDLQYYPVVFTVFWIEHKLWGLAPAGYHVVNILVHASGAVVLWRLLKRLRIEAAWLGALLWAIHPVQVDTVAWVTELKNTLSGLFYFTSALFFLRAVNINDQSRDVPSHSFLFYLISLCCFILGLLAKTVICTLPAALILVLVWKAGSAGTTRTIRNCIMTIPFFLVGLGMAYYASQQEAGLVAQAALGPPLNPLQRCMIAGLDVWHYLYTLLVPFPLLPIPPKWQIVHPGIATILAPMCVLALVAILFILRRLLTIGPLLAFLFFLVTLSPALGFINFYTMLYSYVAPHYQYLACAGPLVLLAESVVLLAHRSASASQGGAPRFAARLLPTCVLIVVLLVGTLSYSWIYQSTQRMWEWNVQENPDAWNARHNLAIAYIHNGHKHKAEVQLREALKIFPADSRLHRTLAQLYAAEGRYQEALPEFKRSLALNRNDPLTYLSLGQMYLKLGEKVPALAALKGAVELEPDRSRNRYDYAQALAHFGSLAEAAEQYKIAVALDPTNVAAHYNYGNVLLDLRQPEQAVGQYQAALRINPADSDAWFNLAVAYHELGQDANARNAKRRAETLDAQRRRRVSSSETQPSLSQPIGP